GCDHKHGWDLALFECCCSVYCAGLWCRTVICTNLDDCAYWNTRINRCSRRTGAGLVLLTVVLATMNLPLEAIALIAGVDRFMDMFRTAVNITGDASGAVVINASERHLDGNTNPDNEVG